MRDLEGLITVCAWTRRVKWEGRWVTFEDYLAKRFNLHCTHGICEEAAEQMRNETAEAPLTRDPWGAEEAVPLATNQPSVTTV